MTRTAQQHKLSDVARQLQSSLGSALSALNHIDPVGLKDWLAHADDVHMAAADRALIESLCACLIPITREIEDVFNTLESAGEQLGLLDAHQFRAEPDPSLTLGNPSCDNTLLQIRRCAA
jgi:hypothetical protein